MAKIRDSNPKQSAGGYERLVGNKTMANIFTKAQSTVITNGTELEKIISSKACTINDLNIFIEKCDNDLIDNGVYLCTKKVVKLSDYKLEKHEPDFIVFSVNKSKNICYVVELKDGDAFDTKKSIAERDMLRLFVNHLAPKIPFRTKYYICCFNQMDKNRIVSGLKNTFLLEEVMTGKEFCKILGIDYEDIIALRKQDTEDNFKYVIEKMTEIKEVNESILKKQRNHIVEKDFYDNENDYLE